MQRFLSTPSARRATSSGVLSGMEFVISIHALREEGDVSSWAKDAVDFVFLSTPSARRATRESSQHAAQLGISIHALREEGDQAPESAPACMI